MKIITQSPVTQVKPQTAKPKSRVFAWFTRIALWLIVGIVILIAIGGVYQAVATAMDKRAYPPPGQMVNIGGYNLHLYCMGEGSPTVILETGLGTMSADWANIQPEVASTTRICAYDRAGVGWSDPGLQPRDPQQIAQELHTLLGEANIPGPYVLVGQSFGGLYTRMYAAQYPEDVVGMVLVDASHPDMWSRLPPEVTTALSGNEQQASLLILLSRFGFSRLTAGDFADCGLPPEQCAQEKAFFASTKKVEVWAAEMYAPERDAQVRATGSLDTMPLIVLTASDHSQDFAASMPSETREQFEKIWQELQAELATLSTNSIHRLVDGAGHSSFQLDSAYIPITNAAILQVIEAARAGEVLKP
jgi:pimeloyl-ACP methyl ester carboxylesterase